MELNNTIVTGPVRPAATVIMLRDGAGGLEVFLLKRHGLSDVLGGAFVFPGGKVDAADARLDMEVHLDQPLSDLHTALNEADIDAITAASLYVAAVREVFEESGILFAQNATHDHAERATAMLREGRAFDEVLAHLQLRLHTRSLAPWSRWITPVMPSVMNKRFDTRFFVAAVPAGQVAALADCLQGRALRRPIAGIGGRCLGRSRFHRRLRRGPGRGAAGEDHAEGRQHRERAGHHCSLKAGRA